ncbi:WD40 repeat-containing protein [Ceraceosorus bombacis]|uniref:WD40 repeat-containing protein n=1 Tax=Ceraceosorus bombacis TaxID=401625 RepID=A0A0P1BEZ7_9BASI|nr:WD40 repeat-containing protein [Ceraceosorus bombacis]
MSNIYNHRSLVPAATGGPPAAAPPSASTARLNDLLDFVKHEFEVIGNDATQFKNQRDEFEHRLSAQISEVQVMQQHIMDLENRHSSMAQQYEEEIKRLRALLDARGGAPDGSGPLPAGGERGGPPPAPVGGAGGPPPHLPTAPPSGPASIAPPPAGASYGKGSSAPSPYHPGPPSHMPSGAYPPSRDAQSPGPGPAAGNASLANLSEMDPDEIPKDLKKEGSDWMAIFNPKVKRMLDVNLVHTLMHESVVCCVRFSPDGKYLATGCNRSAQIYDTKTGAKTCVLTEQTNKRGDLYIRSVCFSPDGQFLATGAEDRQIRIWDIAKKKVKHVFAGHKQEIYSLDFSRDGRIIASGSGDKSVRIWDVGSGKCLHVLYTSPNLEHGPSEAGVTSVSISADNRLVAAGALDTLVRVWDAKTGQQLEKLKGHKDSIYSVAFAPDGKSLVSGSLDRTLKIWDLTATARAVESHSTDDEDRTSKATCASTLLGHKDYVLSVSCSPDGHWVASGSKDRGVQFWDPRSGQAQFVLSGHKNSVIAINLSPAGNLLATGSGDFNARIWAYDRVSE